MEVNDLFLVFGPSVIFISIGLVILVFPMNFPNAEYRGPNDSSRFLSYHGISAHFLNLSKDEQEYFKKIGPKAFILLGILSGCTSALLCFHFPSWDKNIICIANSVTFMVILFLYIEKN